MAAVLAKVSFIPSCSENPKGDQPSRHMMKVRLVRSDYSELSPPF